MPDLLGFLLRGVYCFVDLDPICTNIGRYNAVHSISTVPCKLLCSLGQKMEVQLPEHREGSTIAGCLPVEVPLFVDLNPKRRNNSKVQCF
jgi:hypothetical protein